jgi:formate-dependent nitrite reductase cytochrome c552 subunit
VRHLLAIAALLGPTVALGGDLVGPETCKACHPAAYASWREGPHARALESLPERSRANRRCLSCHSPAAEAGLAGVGCEACHGPGRAYAARYVMRDAELARALGLVIPREKACAACHTESTPSLQKFDFQKKLKLIAHPLPRAREAAAAAPATPAPR